MAGDQVAKRVEAHLTCRGERSGPGHEAPASLRCDATQQRTAEPVVLERAVPGRAEHGARDAAVGLAVGAHEQLRAAVALNAPVADLVASRLRAELGRAAGAPAQHLVAHEARAHRQNSEALDRAAAGLDVVVDALAQQLVAAADAEDRLPGGGAGGKCAVQARGAQAVEVFDRRLRPGNDHEVGALDVGW